MKKIMILAIVSLLLVSLIGCSNKKDVTPSSNDNEEPNTNSQFVEYGVAGHIIDIKISDDDSIFGTIEVEGSENNGAQYNKAIVTINANTKIYLEDLTSFDALEVGMYVNVFFEGAVKESYPVQATAKQINVIPDDINDNDSDEK